MSEINYLAVLVAAVTSMVMGYLWFNVLFGEVFQEGLGSKDWTEAKKAEMAKNQTVTYVKQFVMSLVMAYVVAHVVVAALKLGFEGSDLVSSLKMGFWLWLGIALPVRYGESLWNGQKFKYTVVDLGYWLVILLVFSAIFSSWK